MYHVISGEQHKDGVFVFQLVATPNCFDDGQFAMGVLCCLMMNAASLMVYKNPDSSERFESTDNTKN